MSVPPPTTDGTPTGPNQKGRGVQGQYVYWITMSHPKPETVANLGIKVPSDFDRESFSKLMVKAHKEEDIEIVETVAFLEPHASGLKHHNCLVRAKKSFRWLKVAALLRSKYKVCVDYGSNVKTWAEGVIYGRVGSDHKKPCELDQDYVQWALDGNPARLEEFIPRPWQKQGYQRRTKMSPLAFLDLCREHEIQTEPAAWALAEQLENKGDRALMAFLLENDVGGALAKVRSATTAKVTARRATLTRMDILREAVGNGKCTCKAPGECYGLMKDVLDKNKMDGKFQADVVATLQEGRKKGRNLCLVGGPDTAKSYLYKPLSLIYNTYSRPDGGTHQLEELLGKELVFLNDFEYDDDAKKWCGWGYLKRFLEGERLSVARPKNKGGNEDFTSDAPVFFTAPQEIALYRGKKKDCYETSQMDARVEYAFLTHTIPRKDRQEVDPCAHCGARVYLEGDGGPSLPSSSSAGLPQPPAMGVMTGLAQASQPSAPAAQSPKKKAKTGMDMLSALQDVQALKAGGLLDTPEAKALKDKILQDR